MTVVLYMGGGELLISDGPVIIYLFNIWDREVVEQIPLCCCDTFLTLVVRFTDFDMTNKMAATSFGIFDQWHRAMKVVVFCSRIWR